MRNMSKDLGCQELIFGHKLLVLNLTVKYLF